MLIARIDRTDQLRQDMLIGHTVLESLETSAVDRIAELTLIGTASSAKELRELEKDTVITEDGHKATIDRITVVLVKFTEGMYKTDVIGLTMIEDAGKEHGIQGLSVNVTGETIGERIITDVSLEI